MARNDFAGAYEILPTKFAEVYKHPKISEQVRAIGEAKVKAMIQFQLGILASRMTTGGNITPGNDEFIARNLMEMYPTESIADFKVCFERGAMGRYGQIQRMDGITIGEWVGKYLDEKYSELESKIDERKRQDVIKNPVEGMQEIYANMMNESRKAHMVIEHNKAEYKRRFGTIDQEQIDALRNAENEGKHRTKADFSGLTDSDYNVFICDGHQIGCKTEEDARQIYLAAFGKAPLTTERADKTNPQ